ncbi:MAG: hypothetical protein ACPGLY_25360 [Rubripirellula sp.]
MSWRKCVCPFTIWTVLSVATLGQNNDAVVDVGNEPAGVEGPVETAPDRTPTPSVSARPTMIVVVGASGTPEYGQMFSTWADKWERLAEKSKVNCLRLGSETSEVSDRDLLQQSIATISKGSTTPVWIVMIGHGTFARNVANFNLRGRDVSATDLADWLGSVKRPLVIINCASSSGPFVNRLSGPGRVVVTATKSGAEQNFARFGQYLADAMGSLESDLDHDGEVSVQEAFVRASIEVQRFYDSEERLATEHALLDDNGDGKGTPATMFRGSRAIAKAKGGSELDGKSALKRTLSPDGKRLPLTEQEWQLRAELEAELETLRSRRTDLSDEAYDAELEKILVQLANLYKTVEQRMNSPAQQPPD